jgi:hypothetical protein
MAPGEGTLDGTMRQGLDGSASSKALGPQMQLELRPMSHMSGFGHFKVFNGAEIR